MGDLPTCWYCPECGMHGPVTLHAHGGDEFHQDFYCHAKPIPVPMIPPGTPLTVILDTLGYNVVLDGLLNGGPDGHWDVFPLAYGGFKTSTPCYVIAKKPPATDEAHDG